MSAPRILITGGSGRLGSALRALRRSLVAPSSADMDVRDPAAVARVLDQERPDVVLHAAAFTDVAGAEQKREECWAVNVTGTRHLVQALRGRDARLVHVSTDYVFAGTTGGYREDDPLGPPRNYYALTKLVAEESVRTLPGHLIVRTSFRPRPFPYQKAYDDLFTSQDYVDVLAPEFLRLLDHLNRVTFDTLHLATERKSVFELARRSAPEVQPGSRRDANVELPEDISLDLSRWQQFVASLPDA